MPLQLQLEVGPPARGGTCVARYEGRVVFVRHALPGETVVAQVDQGSKTDRFWRADAVEIIEAADGRRDSPCPYSGPGGCGGCDWLHAEPELQIELKSRVLSDTLGRAGFAGELGVDAVAPEVRWRTRATAHADDQGRLGMRRTRSHEVVPVQDCLQWDLRMQPTAVFGQAWEPDSDVQVAIDDGGARFVREVADDRVIRAEGGEHRSYSVAGRDFAVAPHGFWQAHVAAAEVLSAAVTDLLAPESGDHLIDLYAGVGLFGLAAAPAIGARGRISLVEADGEAAGWARVNAPEPWVSVWDRPVLAWARRHRSRGPLVVVDPPRAGLGSKVVSAIGRWRPRRVVYVSCDVGSLARDLRLFVAEGLSPMVIGSFDLFPGTHHLETVVLLEPGRE